MPVNSIGGERFRPEQAETKDAGLAVALPNGMTCHLTSKSLRLLARLARWEIFKRKRYIHPGFELRPNDIVVDVGANIGMFVLWAAPQVQYGRMIAVEPNPAAFACLRLNAERNRLDHVTLVNAAVGRDGEPIQLYYHPGWESMGYSTELRPPWFYTNSRSGRLVRWLACCLSGEHLAENSSEQLVIATRTSIDRIIDQHQLEVINYLKIDCEGSEFEILRNIAAPCWQRIERIAIEYHEYGPDLHHIELIDILQNNGFSVEVEHSFIEWVARRILRARVGAIWARRVRH
jgi:FkbM family methyltransferase